MGSKEIRPKCRLTRCIQRYRAILNYFHENKWADLRIPLFNTQAQVCMAMFVHEFAVLGGEGRVVPRTSPQCTPSCAPKAPSTDKSYFAERGQGGG